MPARTPVTIAATPRTVAQRSVLAPQPMLQAYGPLTHADVGILWRRGPLLHDVGRLQRSCRGAATRDPGHADRRREGGRDDRERPLDVPASGLEAPTGAERGRTRQV